MNTRPWPRGYVITNPLQPPPIAQEIDIHVIDLVTLKQVGTMLRAHKAYTPNNECFFIFLDVCDEYVARYVYYTYIDIHFELFIYHLIKFIDQSNYQFLIIINYILFSVALKINMVTCGIVIMAFV